MESEFLLAKDVARRLGLRTSTLRKWRQLGKGPRGWRRLGKTTVVYPIASVRAFLDGLSSTEMEGGRRCRDEASFRGSPGTAVEK